MGEIEKKSLEQGNFWSGEYEKNSSPWGNTPSSCLIRSFPLIKETSPILDLGCGYGRDTLFLFRNEINAYGVDASRKGIAIAKSNAQEMGMNPDRFSCSDVLNLNFHNDYFGGAVSHRMYHLLTKDQRERFIKEISRVLKPNGFFALTSRSTKDPSLLESVTISENGARELSFRKGHIINAVNEVELRTILEEHLKIIDLYEYEEQERIGSNRETSLLYALCKNKG